MSKSSNLNIRIPDDLYQAIKEVSKAERMTKSALILPILQDIFMPNEEQVIVIKRPVVPGSLAVSTGWYDRRLDFTVGGEE